MTGDALQDLLDRYTTAPDNDTDTDGGEAEPAYGSLAEWVELWLLPALEQRARTGSATGGADTRSPIRWCADWWRHPEVVARLGGLWRAWETLRQDPGTGMAAWWRDHLDPCWTALGRDYGPLSRCTTDHCGGPVPPLPANPPPTGWEPPVH